MMSLTCCGADAGATAMPSPLIVALSPGAVAGGFGFAGGCTGGGSAGLASAPPVSSAALATSTLRMTFASWRVSRPLTFRSSVFWNDLTAASVAGPYWPSAEMLNPRRARFSCKVWTSPPFMPGRSVR